MLQEWDSVATYKITLDTHKDVSYNYHTETIRGKIMKLFLISSVGELDYDMYEEAVVCAKDEKEAVYIHPNGRNEREWWKRGDNYTWDHPDAINCDYLGEARKEFDEAMVICASFNVG